MAFSSGFHSILQERRKARSAHVTKWACGTRTGPGLPLGPRLQQTSSLCMAAPKNIFGRASEKPSENNCSGSGASCDESRPSENTFCRSGASRDALSRLAALLQNAIKTAPKSHSQTINLNELRSRRWPKLAFSDKLEGPLMWKKSLDPVYGAAPQRRKPRPERLSVTRCSALCRTFSLAQISTPCRARVTAV